MTLPDPSLAWPLPYQDGVVPIANDEDCKLKAYRNFPREPWTCGWGETEGVTPSTAWTQEYADQRFCDSLTERVTAVREACKIEPTPNQLAALVRFAYNYGGWRTSSVLKAHNRGDFMAAATAFGLVVNVRDKDGKLVENAGLKARRAREAAQYLKPSEGAHVMPQAPAPEKPMAASPTVQWSTIGAGAAVIKAASESIDAVKAPLESVRSFAHDWLGVPTEWVPWVLLAVIGGTVLWRRFKQRRDGLA